MNRNNNVRRNWSLLLLVLLFLLPACRSGNSDTRRPDIGTRLPSVLTGTQMRNAPVGEPPAKGGWIVYAFSPLSPKSEAHQKDVEALSRSLPRGWVLLALSTETEGVSAFAERLQAKVPVLTQMPRTTLMAYRITSTPRTYVLNKDWKLLEVLDGPFEGQVAERFAARLKTKPANTAEDASKKRAEGPSSRSLCRDHLQAPYSRGSKADALGVKLRCGPEGVWLPAG